MIIEIGERLNDSIMLIFFVCLVVKIVAWMYYTWPKS